MNRDLEQALVRDFPSLFCDYGCDPRKSCMAFGCDVADGWEPLIRETCKRLAALRIGDLALSQVKEKFGLLRIYTSHDEYERVWKITAAAENTSATICEQCGAPGTIRSRGWHHVACDKCEAKRQ